MPVRELLITGGAGFVGSTLAVAFKRQFPNMGVTAFDNLRRRGSELALTRLRAAGVRFVHGDVRCPEDLAALPPFDLLLDCAAEPSVLAGTDGNPAYVVQTNLGGTVHCLEAARRHRAAFLYLSTSRVYPIPALNELLYEEQATRFNWIPTTAVRGFSAHGIAEDFALQGPRSLYGASKLAGELLVQEYAYHFGMKALINRCGLLAGPWQMGKADQGVVALWAARHFFDQPLQFLGFGGTGKQVRDVLHIDDLCDLVCAQIQQVNTWNGDVFNVGGGWDNAVSLRELTQLCAMEMGRSVPITAIHETRTADLRLYVTDARKVRTAFPWRPCRNVSAILGDIFLWLQEHGEALRPILG